MRRTLLASCILLTHAALANAAVVETHSTPELTVKGARQVLELALAHGRVLGTTGAIAVVDRSGALLAFERLEGTFGAAAAVSVGKARTAATFERPTRVFEEAIAKGRTALTAMPDFTPLQGGVPLMLDGQTVGAIGVSGAASAQQDEEIALAAAKDAGLLVEGTTAAAPAKERQ